MMLSRLILTCWKLSAVVLPSLWQIPLSMTISISQPERVMLCRVIDLIGHITLAPVLWAESLLGLDRFLAADTISERLLYAACISHNYGSDVHNISSPVQFGLAYRPLRSLLTDEIFLSCFGAFFNASRYSPRPPLPFLVVCCKSCCN
ncbi:hypothetical protein LIPSTDRAFT_175960 [Lipomyces starkeyi NRRL Y-11557]|uniref:Uncharacterized protein n=1 Tax=Lipomyces starkeyi NRRL Y-11557 TaxID=675824 RepID=A0A1E3PXI4_LIPST|nr:hypothetical protein LIPSTDRAFT_175960 [Lipomyces starkeyi NRRL Y-11557]